MKAVVYNKSALPYKLVYKDIEKPVPNADEVLIKVHAVSLNAADYRSMQMRLIPKKKIFGADISGIVESIGSNIKNYKPGDEVIGEIADYGFGGLAEYAVATEKFLIQKPKNISHELASALPIAGLTALQALRNKGMIRNGHDVLIIGSGGGVGTFAVQLAKYFGANVTAVCGPSNTEIARKLAADNIIDYTKENFTKSDKKYDLILAVNGNYSIFSCKKLLKEQGRYVIVGGALVQILRWFLFGWLLSLGSKKFELISAKPVADDMEFLATLASEGKISPVIEEYIALEKAPEAMHNLAEGHAKGKIVVKVI